MPLRPTKASIKKSTIKKAERDGRAFRKGVGKGSNNQGASDSFVNYGLNIGMGTNNALSGSSYGFNPITLQRPLLEWIHRGSWLGGIAIDLLADDMTRGGVELLSTNKPEDISTIQQTMVRLKVWNSLNDTIKWAKLYGGCLGVLLLEGQNPDTPLRLETVNKGQFKGLMVLDRWMVDPDLQHLVSHFGPHLGLPEYYRVISDAPAMRNQKIHYTRCIRLEGIRLPYWQRVMNNLWGLSVFERLYDRMVAFDSATMGASQLVYKSFIRTYKIDGLREAATAGGDSLAGIMKLVELMRKYQGIEGITLLDSKDTFEATQSSGFAGISDALLQFAQQLSGALQIPLVRLMGQSPAGLSSTGESDLRTYYDGILQTQEREMREGLNTLLRVTARSEGIDLPKEFGFNFVPLWQLSEDEKSQVADRDTKMVLETEASGLISQKVALKELQQHAKVTGRWTNIDNEMIDQASDIVTAPEPETGEEGEGAPEGESSEEEKEQEQAGALNVEGLKRFKQLQRAVGKDRTHDDLPYTEIGGIQVVIEQPKGSIRRGAWGETVMPADYGYIRRVGSAEGSQEWLDCFVGKNHGSREVWVIDSVNPETGSFDEHKAMLGFTNSHEALSTFRKAYHDSAVHRIGAVTHMSMDEARFKNWLAKGDMTQPLQPDKLAVA